MQTRRSVNVDSGADLETRWRIAMRGTDAKRKDGVKHTRCECFYQNAREINYPDVMMDMMIWDA